MKVFVLFSMIVLIIVAWPQGFFTIQPQTFELKQLIFILTTIITFLGIVYLFALRQGRKALYLYFFFFPFLAQSVNYINFSSSFFILTPPLLGLLTIFFLTKSQRISPLLRTLLVFSLSIFISVIIAKNVSTAMVFFISGVGSFTLSAYLIYCAVKTSEYPEAFIRNLIFSLVGGSTLYFFVESIAFQIKPSDLIYIIMRRWDLLPIGRYFTAGFTEPAGMAMVYSWIFWIIFFILIYYQRPTEKKWSWIAGGIFVVSIGFLVISGTRTAIFNFVYILILAWLINRILKLKSFRIPLRLFFIVSGIIIVSAYLLLPRTILSQRSEIQPDWITPTYMTVFGHTYQLVGTTADYYNQTLTSLNDFAASPLGSGPLNATPIYDSVSGQWTYYYSFITNLIVVGATFGWLSLLIWLIFIGLTIWQVIKLRRLGENQTLFGLTIVLLSIVLSSFLPGSSYLGPMINWANFDRTQVISPHTASLLAEYPAIISGMIIGLLIGSVEFLLIRFRQMPEPEKSMVEAANG